MHVSLTLFSVGFSKWMFVKLDLPERLNVIRVRTSCMQTPFLSDWSIWNMILLQLFNIVLEPTILRLILQSIPRINAYFTANVLVDTNISTLTADFNNVETNKLVMKKPWLMARSVYFKTNTNVYVKY